MWSVIQFVKKDHGQTQLDLVPTSWVCNIADKLMVRYPDDQIAKLSGKLEPSREEWKTYEIILLNTNIGN